jgi:hypothetical protein
VHPYPWQSRKYSDKHVVPLQNPGLTGNWIFAILVRDASDKNACRQAVSVRDTEIDKTQRIVSVRFDCAVFCNIISSKIHHLWVKYGMIQ